MLRFLFALLLALNMVSVARAQTQDPEAVLMLNEIIEVSGAIKRGQEIMPFVMDQMSKVYISANPDKGPQIAKLLKEDVGPRFIARFPEIRPDVVALYMQTFTLEEIRFMHANTVSATGRAIAAKQAQMLPMIMQTSTAFAQKLCAEIMQELAPKFRENGIKL